MSTIRPVAAVLFTCLWAATAHAIPIPGLFNTGVDGSNVVLAGNSVDPHYTMIVSADPSFPGPNAIVPTVIPDFYWLANGTTSKWISAANDEGYPTGGTPHPDGNYIFRLSFSLSGLDPASASVTGTYGADNAVAILLNGVATGINTTSYNPLVPFAINSGFVSGTNHLDFVVNNYPAGGSNPLGVRVDNLSGTSIATTAVDDGPIGRALELSVPFPNPARDLARFSFTLPRAGMARLVVRDLAGRTVRTLVQTGFSAGRHEASWDGLRSDGTRSVAGVYFVDLEAEDRRLTRRIVWMP
jgi:hypothetical protein